MQRRVFLAIAGGAALAGCSGGSDGDDPATEAMPAETPTEAPTRTSTPEPTSTPTPQETQSGVPTQEEIDYVRENAEAVMYNEWFRNNEEYVEEPILFRWAKVDQALYGEEVTQLHLYVSNGSRREAVDDIFAWWYGEERILEDDWLEIYGVSGELYTYETVRGEERTVPSLWLIDFELLDED